MNRKTSIDCFVSWWSKLTDEQKSVFPDSLDALTDVLSLRVEGVAESTYVVHVSDSDAVQLLIHWEGYVYEKAVSIVKSWRRYAMDRGYNGPVCWNVKAGFTLLDHARVAGPCSERAISSLRAGFIDEPTSNSLIFWIPLLVEGSMDSSISQMEVLRNTVRTSYGMSEKHCTSFGSIELLVALIFTHYRRTGIRVPLNGKFALSDSSCSRGEKSLVVSWFGQDGLDWIGLYKDLNGLGGTGFFALGVEKLG